jgi:polysaccharide biosynthesis transport protein
LAILRRRAGLILLCLALGAVFATGLSLLQQKEYSASATLLFRNPGFAEDLFGTTSTSVNSSVPAREAATNEKLVGLKVIGVRTAKALDGLSPADVNGMISVSAQGEAELVSVTATSPDPQQSRVVSNTFAREFISFRAEADKSRLLSAKRLAEREFGRLSGTAKRGVRGQALSRAAEKLGVLASLQTGNAELVQPASVPTSPSSPKTLRNAILGGILGLAIGLAAAFLSERLNRKLRDPEEAQEAFRLPVLGTVPESKGILASNEGGIALDLPFAENEAFRMLRSSLQYFNVDREIRSLLIASHGPGAGKTTIAWHLARMAAKGSKVIVLETDLRNPSLAVQHRLRQSPGLGAILTHQVNTDEAIQSIPLLHVDDGNGTKGHSLDVIVSGPPPPNPAELIESRAMKEVLAELVERYDLVVIDTAPVGVVSDAFPLIREVDGVILVARMMETTNEAARHVREQLENLRAPVLGLVANGVRLRRGGQYGYGQYGNAEEPTRDVADATPPSDAARR